MDLQKRFQDIFAWMENKRQKEIAAGFTPNEVKYYIFGISNHLKKKKAGKAGRFLVRHLWTLLLASLMYSIFLFERIPYASF